MTWEGRLGGVGVAFSPHSQQIVDSIPGAALAVTGTSPQCTHD